MIKKLFVILLAATVIGTSLGLNNAEAYAAGGPVVEISDGQGKIGDTVSLTMSAKENPGFCAMEINLNYDSSKLELVSIDECPTFGGMWVINKEDGKAVFANLGGDVKDTGDMLSLSFKIKSGANFGSTEVSAVCTAGNWNEERLETSIVPGTIEIGCAHINTELSGQKEASATEKGYTGDKVCSDCGEVIEKGKEIPALKSDGSGSENKDDEGKTPHDCEKDGHVWNKTEYKWIGEEQCIASRSCKYDSSHVETAEAEISSEISKAPTYMDEKGEKTLKAEFKADWAEAQSKVVEFKELLPMPGADIKVTPPYNGEEPSEAVSETEMCNIVEALWSPETAKFEDGASYELKLVVEAVNPAGRFALDGKFTINGKEAEILNIDGSKVTLAMGFVSTEKPETADAAEGAEESKDEADAKESSSISTGAVVGIILAVVVIAAAIILIKKRKVNKEK